MGSSTPAQQARVGYLIMAPWLCVGVVYLIFFVILWETAICLIMLAPITFGLASLGGVLSGVVIQYLCKFKRGHQGMVGCVAMLPVLIGLG